MELCWWALALRWLGSRSNQAEVDMATLLEIEEWHRLGFFHAGAQAWRDQRRGLRACDQVEA